MTDYKDRKPDEDYLSVFDAFLYLCGIVSVFIILSFLPELVYFFKDL